MHIAYEQEYMWDLLCRVPGHIQGFILQKPIHMNLRKFATLHIESGLGEAGSLNMEENLMLKAAHWKNLQFPRSQSLENGESRSV